MRPADVRARWPPVDAHAAGTELLPYAEHALAAVNNGERAIRATRGLIGGTASLGVMRYAEYYLLPELALRFHHSHPGVRLRLVGQNSLEVAATVATGQLEAGLVVLPVDGTGLDVRPLLQDEVFVATTDPARYGATASIEAFAAATLVLYDAHYGWEDPTRRQLAERAQLAGKRLSPIIEVEHVSAALALAASGVGDTTVSRTVAAAAGFPAELRLVPFADPVYDTVAEIQREGVVLTPASRRLLHLTRKIIRARAD